MKQSFEKCGHIIPNDIGNLIWCPIEQRNVPIYCHHCDQYTNIPKISPKKEKGNLLTYTKKRKN